MNDGEDVLSRLLVCVLGLIFSHAAIACTKDIDCKGDRICTEGVCAAPTPSPTSRHSADGSGENRSVSKNTSGTRSVSANLLGLLQFGITPTIEWGESSTFLLRTRVMNAGVLPYFIAGLEDEDFRFGLGVTTQWRRYLGGQPQSGAYFGGGVEVMYTQSEGDAVYETTFLVPQLEGGVRTKHSGDDEAAIGGSRCGVRGMTGKKDTAWKDAL